jgi:ribosome-binding factor A
VPKDFPRSRRVADEMQRELADLVRQEVKDPRVGFITITAVEVTRDLEHATVFFTRMDGEAKAADSLKALSRAAGFLRSQLGHRMRLRLVPELRFRYDASVAEGVRVSHLIDEAVAEDRARHPDDQ